jgi:uncharacterized protein
MLAMLFGAGMALQYQRRKDVEGAWPGGYVRRSFTMLGIGLVHGFGIWFGDILTSYGVTSLAAISFVKRPDVRKYAVWILGVIVAGLILVITLTEIAESARSSPPASTLGVTPEIERAVFQGSSFLAQLKLRFSLFGEMLMFAPILVMDLLVLFMVGMFLLENGVLTRPAEHLQLLRRLVVLGFGFGSLLTGVGVYWHLETLIEAAGAPFLAIGYLSIGLMIVASAKATAFVNLFATVGRFAMSVYLLQSVLASFVFYGWGLGQYGRVSFTESLIWVLPIWGVCISAALLWDRWFKLGPAEWLLRSITEWERLPIRRVSAGPSP